MIRRDAWHLTDDVFEPHEARFDDTPSHVLSVAALAFWGAALTASIGVAVATRLIDVVVHIAG